MKRILRVSAFVFLGVLGDLGGSKIRESLIVPHLLKNILAVNLLFVFPSFLCAPVKRTRRAGIEKKVLRRILRVSAFDLLGALGAPVKRVLKRSLGGSKIRESLIVPPY